MNAPSLQHTMRLYSGLYRERECCLLVSFCFFAIFFSRELYFINLQSMERRHSTLELVKHDETARAPERDWDATAFELDTSALALQVSTI